MAQRPKCLNADMVIKLAALQTAGHFELLPIAAVDF